MAFRGYEMFLILRGQNYASGAIRSVAGDMQRLGAASAASGKQLTASSMMMQRAWMRVGIGSSILRDTGRQARMLGIMAGAGVAVAAKAAADFESDVTRVATQTGAVNTGMVEVAKNARILGPELLKIGKVSTSSLEEINEAGYDLFSTFTRLSDEGPKGLVEGTKILGLLNKAAIGGATNMEDVTNGVVAVVSAWETARKKGHRILPTFEGFEGVNKVLTRMFAAVRFGRMSFAEFAAVLGTTAPAARAAGQSFDTMAGTVAFLSRPLGINKAAIGFARLSEIFSRRKFLEGLDEAGVSITDAQGNFVRFDEIIQRIVKRFPELIKSDKALAQFFKTLSGTEGTIQARRAFVFLAKNMAVYRDILRRTIGDNTEFSRSFNAMSQTSGVRWKKFVNRFKVSALEIGKAAIPEIEKISKPLQDLANRFSNLDKQARGSIARWAVLGSVLAVVGGTLGALVGGFGVLISSLGRARILLPIVLAFLAAIAGATKSNVQAAQLFHNAFEKAFSGMLSLLGKLIHTLTTALPAAMSGFSDLAVSDWKNFILLTGLATFGVFRLIGVLKRAKVAQAAMSVMAARGVGAFLTGGFAAGTAAALAQRQALQATKVNVGLSAAAKLRMRALENLSAALAGGMITQGRYNKVLKNAQMTERKSANFVKKWSGATKGATVSTGKLTAATTKAKGAVRLLGAGFMLLPGP
ncbi:MAG: Prophage protein, partial [Candidatus Gottesmanbacteria bacterium GW2011_GWB1_49_7]